MHDKSTWDLIRNLSAKPTADYSHVTGVRCFWMEPTGYGRIHLRRYRSSHHEDKCVGTGWYHNANGPVIGDFKEVRSVDGYIKGHALEPELTRDDPRWPKRCDACGYEFVEEDEWQQFGESLYRRVDTNEVLTRRGAPVGAMFDAWWMVGTKGPDGRCLVVKLPGDHDWTVDGNCSNCNDPDGKHYCWPRRGEVPDITVSKEYGGTCTTGHGSVIITGWRGTIRQGYLIHD